MELENPVRSDSSLGNYWTTFLAQKGKKQFQSVLNSLKVFYTFGGLWKLLFQPVQKVLPSV